MASVIDLAGVPLPVTEAGTDVCVIGAGAAGLYLATALAKRGRDVVVLEAGSGTCTAGSDLGIDVTFSGREYRGATEGRVFGLGGSTSRWGGLVVPHSDLDLRNGVPDSETWRHVVGVVRETGAGVAGVLGLGVNPDFLSFPERYLGQTAAVLRERGLTTVASAFLPFRRRNFFSLTKPRTTGTIHVYLNAVVSRWSCGTGAGALGHVNRVEAVSPNRQWLRVTARRYVIAAGAIESARMLLEIDRVTNGRMLPPPARIGCYLSDHLSCPIACVHPADRNLAARIFGPVFSKGRMRSFRFIATSDGTTGPRHFAHFIFDIQHPGFRLAKEALSRLQRRQMPRVRLTGAPAELSSLARLAYSRFVKSRLLAPDGTSSRLQLDVEQTPVVTNRVYLGRDTDQAGRPAAILHWDISTEDRANIASLAAHVLKRWPGDGVSAPRLIPSSPEGDGFKPHDAYHAVGTCRMGNDPESTLDLSLGVKGCRNLYVLSTGALPSAGTANPTFTMLCLGEQLSDHLTGLAPRFSATPEGEPAGSARC